MLRFKPVLGILGGLLMALGGFLLLPAAVGLLYGEDSWWPFLVSALIGIAGGGALWYLLPREEDLRPREGMMIVSSAWILLSLLGALPFVLGGILDSYTDAFFETMSGFTTTGATILGGAHTPSIEELPRAFLFWRSLAHWLGGMGIIVLALAILPLLGVGGMQLYKAEVPGPSADKLTPRVKDTAKRLWFIYTGLTVVQTLLLWPAMGLFDAINHAFATMATGGFSTRNASVAAYDSAYVDWVIILFMFLAGMNFALHYQWIVRGRLGRVWKDEEFRMYVGVIGVAVILVTLAIWRPAAALLPVDPAAETPFEEYSSLLDALRYAAFQVVSIVTTTGFGTDDYEIWPPLGAGIIFLLFFAGGMAGSTGGGIKMVRHLLLYKNSYNEINRIIHPQAILTVRMNGRVVPRDVMRNVLSFAVLYMGTVGVGTLVMTLSGMDLLSAFGGTLSCVGNIGPAFGTLGPTENYAHIPDLGKWMLSLLMVIGRLEIFTVLSLFVPAFWRR